MMAPTAAMDLTRDTTAGGQFARAMDADVADLDTRAPAPVRPIRMEAMPTTPIDPETVVAMVAGSRQAQAAGLAQAGVQPMTGLAMPAPLEEPAEPFGTTVAPQVPAGPETAAPGLPDAFGGPVQPLADADARAGGRPGVSADVIAEPRQQPRQAAPLLPGQIAQGALLGRIDKKPPPAPSTKQVDKSGAAVTRAPAAPAQDAIDPVQVAGEQRRQQARIDATSRTFETRGGTIAWIVNSRLASELTPVQDGTASGEPCPVSSRPSPPSPRRRRWFSRSSASRTAASVAARP